MARHGKAYNDASARYDREQLHTPERGVRAA